MLKTQVNISKVEINDLKDLQALGRQTFVETFAAGNSESNLQLYLNSEFTDEKMLSELHHPDSLFYFAKIDNRPIGYLKVNFGNAQTELQDKRGLEIERIYALKEFHGMGVGQLLFNKAMEIANENHLDYLWLGVWEENKRAISFYEKNGFVKFSTHLFRLGDDMQTDIMMRLDLGAGN